MKESLSTFFWALIGSFILCAVSVKLKDVGGTVGLWEILKYYGFFSTNGVLYGLSVMFAKDIYRYIAVPLFKRIKDMKFLHIIFSIGGAGGSVIGGYDLFGHLSVGSFILFVIFGVIAGNGLLDWIKNLTHGHNKTNS
jgi:hypothetical protein